MPAHGQAFLDQDATARTHLAGIGRRHGYGLFPSVSSFENKDGTELTPARVTDAFGEMVILDHIGTLQIFMSLAVRIPTTLQAWEEAPPFRLDET